MLWGVGSSREYIVHAEARSAGFTPLSANALRRGKRATYRARVDTQSIAVVGAGAIGCYFAARLAHAGHDVTLLTRPGTAGRIASGVLTVRYDRQAISVPVEVTDDTECLSNASIVLVCVKSYSTREVATRLHGLLSPGALVVSLQNGVDNAEVLGHALDRPVISAAVYVAVDLESPGDVRHHARGDLEIGFSEDIAESYSIQLHAVQRAFTDADVPCAIATDIRQRLWQKLAMNCCYNAISALAECRYGTIRRDRAGEAIIGAIAREVAAVANAKGIWLDPGALSAAALALGNDMAGTYSSTYRDLVRGRPTEIESLNGYVVRQAEALGLQSSINGVLTTLVSLRERGTASSVAAS